MSWLQSVVFALLIFGSVFALVGVIVALRMLLYGEYKEYRKRYNDFLAQKDRVERRLRKAARD